MGIAAGGTVAGVVSSVSAEEALGGLTPDERRWVEEFRDQARELLGERLADMRLFGSKARGDSGPESDIDVLVLVRGLDASTNKALAEMAYFVSTWLTPLIAEYEAYHAPASRATGLYEAMRNESVRL